ATGGRGNHLVRIANQIPAHFPRSLPRRLEPLRESHLREPLRRGVLVLVLVTEVEILAGVEERLFDRRRLVDLNLRNLVREDAAVAKELAQAQRYVRPREKHLQRLLGDAAQRRVGRVADVVVRILEQQRENLQLLERTRRERALGP